VPVGASARSAVPAQAASSASATAARILIRP
jgi:hypothetical protein